MSKVGWYDYDLYLLCMMFSHIVRVGVRYNIPVTIWLRPNHPYSGPLVYVSPTGDMGIQQSHFVDSSGLIYLPYLAEWKEVSLFTHKLMF